MTAGAWGVSEDRFQQYPETSLAQSLSSFSFSFSRMVLCVGCLGGTVLYVCIEYHI